MLSFSTNSSSPSAKVKTKSFFHTFSGRTVHRLHCQPRGKIRRSFVFFHGQGDFIDRYPDLLQPIIDEGSEIIMTDLPGHGRSCGTRGDVPSLAFVDRLFRDSFAQLTPEVPKGVCGHSMGGMIALWLFLKDPASFQFAWFSSPLLRPGYQISSLERLILLAAAAAFPERTRSTGVRASDCAPASSDLAPPASSPLHHARISLRWARELVHLEQIIEDRFSLISDGPPILFTQGLKDLVCPPEFLMEKLRAQATPNVTLTNFPEALHEPFRDTSQSEFHETLHTFFSQFS